jgi:molecular chaperone HscA
MLIQIHEPGQSPLPHQNDVAVGIDLGTTNSLIAISSEEKPEVITNEQGEAITPSIFNIEQDGNIKIGNIENFTSQVRSIKRLMWRGLKDIESEISSLGFEIDIENSSQVIRVKLGKKSLSAIEISAEILKELKLKAEAALGKEVKKAVITVPAYFDDAARNATKDAAKLAGLETLRLVNEPTAAALAYGLDKGVEGIFAIYDLGGGTFDVSILRMQGGVFQVIATGGDTKLGGDDFDELLIEKISKDLGISNNDNQKINALKQQAKDLKEQLSSNNSAEIEVDGKKFSITKIEFENLISPLVNRTLEIFKNVLLDAKIAASEINETILVGGSTRVPFVQKTLEKLLGKKPLNDVDPDKVVALGAAIQAEALTRGSNFLLLDVCPLSLGLETYGGLMEVLIGRNTPIPATATQKFTTYEDGQTAMKIHVLQGERELVENCRSLAKFDLRGIPSMPSGAAVVEVTFNLDADGILTVSAREETTGVEQKVEVKPSYGLNEKEMEKMLFSSMENAEADIKERILREARMEANVTVKAVKSALIIDGNLIDDNYRKVIENQIVQTEKAIAGTDRELIDFQVMELDNLSAKFVELRVNTALEKHLVGKKA